MLEPYQMLLVFYRWWELHIDVSFYFPSDPSGVIISQSSFYPVHDDCIMVLFHHFINAVIIFIICIILSLSAMMILSAASFGIIICISSLPWHSRHLHHPIITSAFIHCHFLIVKNMEQEFLVTSSLCLPSLHFRSAPCWKIPFSFQGAIRLFHDHKPSNSISFPIMLRCLGNQIDPLEGSH